MKTIKGGEMIKIIKAEYHRNGVGGAPFYAVLFTDSEMENAGIMIASIFEEPAYCSVYSVKELENKNIEFANGNSWRGDYYRSRLWPLLIQYTKDHDKSGPFS